MPNRKEKSGVKVFPNNFEAEQSLLCCVLIDGMALSDIVPRLDAEAFYDPVNRKIFQAIKDLYAINAGIDIITVNDYLEKKNLAEENTLFYLTEINNLLPSGANYNQYAKILKRDMVLRDIINKCNLIVTDAYGSTDESATLKFAEEQIYGISKALTKRGLEHISDASAAVMERLDILSKDKTALRGLMTNFPIFDRTTNGLQNGDLIILAARPSVGKTAFALNIVTNIVRGAEEKPEDKDKSKKKPKEKPKTIAIFSLEMASMQLAQRLMCNLAGVEMSAVSRGDVQLSGHKNLWAVTQELSNSQIYINDTSMITPAEILSQCRRLPSVTGAGRLDLIVIDYLQLMQSMKSNKSGSREQEIAEMSRMMKILAREMECPVILLSQMSRESEKRKDKTPVLSDLRESGAIEQDADIVMFLSREQDDDKANSPIFLDIAKHRNGELKRIRMNWCGEYMRFLESEDQSESKKISSNQKKSSETE